MPDDNEASDFGAEIDEAIARNVKSTRERIGWSQGELAARLGEMGVSGFHQTTVARIESGQRSLRISEALALARLFDEPLESLAESSATSSLRSRHRELEKAVRVFREATENLMEHRIWTARHLDEEFPYGEQPQYLSNVLRKVNPAAFDMLDELLYANSSPADLIGMIYWDSLSRPDPRLLDFEPWVPSRTMELYADLILNSLRAHRIADRTEASNDEFEREVGERWGCAPRGAGDSAFGIDTLPADRLERENWTVDDAVPTQAFERFLELVFEDV